MSLERAAEAPAPSPPGGAGPLSEQARAPVVSSPTRRRALRAPWLWIVAAAVVVVLLAVGAWAVFGGSSSHPHKASASTANLGKSIVLGAGYRALTATATRATNVAEADLNAALPGSDFDRIHADARTERDALSQYRDGLTRLPAPSSIEADLRGLVVAASDQASAADVISVAGNANSYKAAADAYNAAEQRANSARAVFERDLANLGLL
jgi:hypothetical protein